MKSILDPSFRYTPSVETDVRKTFARIRCELRAQGAKGPRAAAETAGHSNVLALSRRQPLPASAR
jgi:hypothetical protein